MMRLPTTAARLPGLFGLILLGACAQGGTARFPSLLPRAIESRSDAEPTVPDVVAAPDPALDATAADVMRSLETNRQAFATAAARAQAAAGRAKGAATGSDRWLDAQTALAELDVFRATSSGLVSDLDDLSLARAADGKAPYPAIETARTMAQAELDAETARIGALQASLPEA